MGMFDFLNPVTDALHSGMDAVFGTPSRSGPQEIPGIIGRPEAAGYLNQATGLIGQDAKNQALLDSLNRNPSTTSYTAPLQSAILNPNFSPVSTANQNLVNQAVNTRQGSVNALGFGSSPGYQASVAAAAAPTLSALHQQVVGNLQTAENSSQQVNQARMQNVLQSLDEELKKRGIDINALLSAASEGKPQVSTTSTGANPGLLSDIGGFIKDIGGGGGSGGASTVMA